MNTFSVSFNFIWGMNVLQTLGANKLFHLGHPGSELQITPTYVIKNRIG